MCRTSLLKGSCSASLIKLAPFWTSFLSCSLCHRAPSTSMTHGKPEQYLDSWKHDQTDSSRQWDTSKAPSISYILINGRPNHWWRKFVEQEAWRHAKNSCEDNDGGDDKPRKEKVSHCEGKDTFPVVTGWMNVLCQYAQLHELHNMHRVLIGIR